MPIQSSAPIMLSRPSLARRSADLVRHHPFPADEVFCEQERTWTFPRLYQLYKPAKVPPRPQRNPLIHHLLNNSLTTRNHYVDRELNPLLNVGIDIDNILRYRTSSSLTSAV
jgi:hypothetical protein